MALINDWIAIFIPGFLLIILNGLNTLSTLKILMGPKSISLNIMETIEKKTMMKSILFQLFLR